MKLTKKETAMRKLAAAYMAPQLTKKASLQDMLAAYGIGLEKRAADITPDRKQRLMNAYVRSPMFGYAAGYAAGQFPAKKQKANTAQVPNTQGTTTPRIGGAGDYFAQQTQRRNAEANIGSPKAPEQFVNQDTATTGIEADVDWRNSPYANTLNMVEGAPLRQFNNTGRWNDYRPGELPWQNAALNNAQSMAEKSTPFGSSPAVRRAAGLIAREKLKQQEADSTWLNQGKDIWWRNPQGMITGYAPGYLTWQRTFREPGLDKLRNHALPAGYATPAN